MTTSSTRSIPPEDAAGNTQAEQAAAELQRAIVSGELPSGSRLCIRVLQQRFGFGATPLREGLSRLVAAGFVRANNQRGFSVVPTSRADLEDILRVRLLIESEALRLAMDKGDAAWEADIVANLHRIRRALGDASSNDGRQAQGDFNTVHFAFHTALLAACDSPRLLELHRSLFDQTFRYRQFSWHHGQLPPQRAAKVMEEHQRLADAIMKRKVKEALRLLEEHLAITLRLLDDRTATQPARKSRRPGTT